MKALPLLFALAALFASGCQSDSVSAAPAVDPAVRQEQTQAAIDSSEMTEEQKQQAKAYDAYGSEMSEKMKDSYRKAGAPVDGP